jgi:hypothetical protein
MRTSALSFSRRRLTRSATIAVAAAAIVACGGTSSSSVGGISADTACADYASAICTKVSTCGATLTQLLWGDAATCTTRFKQACATALTAPSTSSTPDRAEACSKALASAGCDALLDRNLPTDCRAEPGKLVNGTACGDDGQCTSSYCNKGVDAVCGTCGTGRPKAGEACASDDNCDYGLKCANKLCVAPAPAGATCDVGHPCATALTCDGTTCAKAPADGQACKGDGLGNCDVGGGEFCGPKMKVCKKLKSASAGQTCGYDATTDDFTFCAASGTCKTMTGSPTGTCLAAAADGATCDPTNGPACKEGSKCVSGVCRIQDPSSCR